MSKFAILMRSWKVEITNNGQVAFSRNILAQGASEALDAVWRLFDPNQTISLFDTSYSSSAKNL